MHGGREGEPGKSASFCGEFQGSTKEYHLQVLVFRLSVAALLSKSDRRYFEVIRPRPMKTFNAELPCAWRNLSMQLEMMIAMRG